MRIRESSDRGSSGRLVDTLLDWVKKIMQLAVLAVVALAAYLIYGFFSGGVGSWTSLDPAAQARIAGNIQGTIFWFNVALVVLLATAIILYYDEESFGYLLIVVALLLYFGLPFLIDSQMPGQMAAWQQTRNMPMLAIYHEARIVALILVVPGAGLSLYDIIRRITSGGREDLTAMKYGGDVKEIAPANAALVNAFAKCWQLPFCRESLRVRCPIYYRKARCWRERVGCMCEEVTIREALSQFFDKKPATEGNLDFVTGLHTEGGPPTESSVPTGPRTDVIRIPEIRRDQVRIPVNKAMPIQMKRERCRSCIIYNEHQRHKYQLIAPLVVLGVPGLAFWQLESILATLKAFLHTADRVMAQLSFDPAVRNVGLASATSSSDVANFVMIGCLVVIATTLVLRWLEHAIFTLKL